METYSIPVTKPCRTAGWCIAFTGKLRGCCFESYGGALSVFFVHDRSGLCAVHLHASVQWRCGWLMLDNYYMMLVLHDTFAAITLSVCVHQLKILQKSFFVRNRKCYGHEIVRNQKQNYVISVPYRHVFFTSFSAFDSLYYTEICIEIYILQLEIDCQ